MQFEAGLVIHSTVLHLNTTKMLLTGLHASLLSLWSIILQCLGGYQSTMPHMKGNILSFYMVYSGMPCPKDLQRYGHGEGPSESPLVYTIQSLREKVQMSKSITLKAAIPPGGGFEGHPPSKCVNSGKMDK